MTMDTEELDALAALTFNWTRALHDVWAPSLYHVEGLHAETPPGCHPPRRCARSDASLLRSGQPDRGEMSIK